MQFVGTFQLTICENSHHIFVPFFVHFSLMSHVYFNLCPFSGMFLPYIFAFCHTFRFLSFFISFIILPFSPHFILWPFLSIFLFCFFFVCAGFFQFYPLLSIVAFTHIIFCSIPSFAKTSYIKAFNTA